MIKEYHWFFKIWFMRKFSGWAVTPNLIICRGEAYDGLIKHERVHQEQMNRHGLLYFWLQYLFYYVSGLVKYKNHWRAYRNNPLEVEARNA